MIIALILLITFVIGLIITLIINELAFYFINSCYDDYPENGGVVLGVFKKKDEALQFIENRLKQDCERKLEDYKLLYCKELKLKAVETVTKITNETF